MQAYSQDLRERVLRALDRGDRPTEIARRFEVRRVWVYQVRDRQQETGVRSNFRSAAIAGPGWRRWNRCCATGSQPSPI
jgi:transposase